MASARSATGSQLFNAQGEVFHLRHPHDIEEHLHGPQHLGHGRRFTGQGEIDMQNEHGVEIRAHTTSAGLKLSLAPTGVEIHFK